MTTGLPMDSILTKVHMKNKALVLVNKAQAAIVLVAFGMAAPLALSAQDVPAAVPASSQLPTLGDSSDMGSAAERRLGDRIAREMYRDPDYIDDPVLVEYVQSIWQPLLQAAKARGDLSAELQERFAWEFMLGRDRTVNAFALPGGYFGIHLGLIAVVISRDELASVLGHEMSHVMQRHISRLLSKQSQQAPWMIGAMLLGVLAASKNADAGNAMIVGGQAVAAQNQLNFSRDMEREADRVGYGVMTSAGFEAQGFVTMFDKLQQASRLNDNGAYPYLRSHPLTTERIADMHARQMLLPPHPDKLATSVEPLMIAARARVLSNPGVDALRDMQLEVANANLATLTPARQVAILYAGALSANRMRDFEHGKTYLARLLPLVRADAPALRLARLLDAEMALTAGDIPRAAAALKAIQTGARHEPASEATALHRPELFLGTQLALQSAHGGAAQDATQVSDTAQRLQLWVSEHPKDGPAWQLLSSAYAAQGQSLRAIRADAEAQVAVLDYPLALDRFKAAQELVKERRASSGAADNIEASIIDTRRRQVELLLKEQALDH